MSIPALGEPSRAARRPLVVAHRGASADEPEHTLTAYRLGLRTGADGLECDVRLTKDHELVCIHDRRLDRTSNGSGLVSEKTRAELDQLDFGAWKTRSAAPDEERDPERHALLTLRHLLDLADEVDHPLLLLIETKHPSRHGHDVERRLVDLLRERGLAGPDRPGRPTVRVMSFSHLALARMRRLAPEVGLVHLVERNVPTLSWRGHLPWGVRTVGLDVAIVREDPGVVDRHHRLGHEVAVWTVDEPADVDLCLRLGVDVLITNRPAQVVAARDA